MAALEVPVVCVMTTLVTVDCTVVIGWVTVMVLTVLVTVIAGAVEVVVAGIGMVVNIETVHGPVAAIPPLEFMVTALLSLHQ